MHWYHAIVLVRRHVLVVWYHTIASSYDIHCSGRNKGQKLVGRFFENQTFCKLLIAVPLKMYSKFG